MSEKSQFHVYAGSKSLLLDWQPYDVMQSTETTFAGLELATQLISHHASIFLGVIILGKKINLDHGNVRGPVQRSERSEPKMKIQHWTSKRKLTESWSYGYLGSSLQKIESTVLIDKGTLMIVHVLSGWLASSYPIRRVFLQHISWRVSVESVINKRKSSCHFAWMNGSIAVWMLVHPTKYGGDIGLKGFLISQKLFLSTSEYHHYYQGRKWNMPEFLKSPYNSLKFIGSFEAAAYWTWFFRLAVLVCFLAVVPFIIFRSNSFKEKQAAKNIL